MTDATTADVPIEPALPFEGVCPGCGATLRNISAAPGASIHCLNCGARHVPIPLASAAAPESPDAPPATSMREPRAAGYWILRFSMMAYCASAPFKWLYFHSAQARTPAYSSKSNWNFWLEGVFDPLVPTAFAALLVIVARSLARIEAATLKATWKTGLLREAIAEPPGSSLPYFGPLAIGSGVMAAVIPVFMRDDGAAGADGSMVSRMTAFMTYFVLALALTDVRQFLWRQHSLATQCARGSGRMPVKSAAPKYTGLLLALAALAYALALAAPFMGTTGSIFRRAPATNESTVLIALLEGLMFAAASVSLYLLGRDFSGVVKAWQGAVPFGARSRHRDVLARWVRIALFSGIGLELCILVLQNTRYRAFMSRGDLFLLALPACFECCFALAQSQIFAELREWRFAQQAFWNARNSLSAAPKLSRLQNGMLLGIFGLIFLQAMAWAVRLMAPLGFSMSWDILLTVFQLIGRMSLTMVWWALVAREFQLAAHMTASLAENATDS